MRFAVLIAPWNNLKPYKVDRLNRFLVEKTHTHTSKLRRYNEIRDVGTRQPGAVPRPSVILGSVGSGGGGGPAAAGKPVSHDRSACRCRR